MSSFNPTDNSWNIDWSVLKEGYGGFAQSLSSKIIGNGFEKLKNLAPENSGSKLWDRGFAEYSLMVPKQIGTVLGGQLTYNYVRRFSLGYNFGNNPNFESESSSWALDYFKFLKGYK